MMTDLMHSGVAHDENPPGRGSGRYGWGTGENPGQHQFDLLSEHKRLKKNGLSDSEIAKMLLGAKGYMKDGTPVWNNTTDLKAAIALESTRQRKINMAKAAELLEKHNGNMSAAARDMGRNEATLRKWLRPVSETMVSKYENTANLLRKRVDEKGMIDVSKATEYSLGCTDNTKKVALSMLEKEGYMLIKVNIPQPGRKGQNTTTLALVKPLEGETPKDTFVRTQRNKYDIQPIEDYTPDAGITWKAPEYPKSMDSKRVMVRYAEDGGTQKDGVIEINPKAKDLSLDGSMYAQVRIMVDDYNYMKGMAIYGQEKDFPKGIDVIYNSNKHSSTPMIDPDSEYDPTTNKWTGNQVLKRVNMNAVTKDVDKDNPFGANIKISKDVDGHFTRGGQHYYTDDNGNEQLSPINKINDEGDWDSWSRHLSSQFLSKQPTKLIKQQLSISIDHKQSELDEILNLNNPVIKKKLLEEYAAGCDANAVDLSAAGIKNQAFQVILPVPSMKSNEVYAPQYNDGDIVALIRYPHAGTFEIPVLKVNNKQKDAKAILAREGRTASDAIGINDEVAETLSGADFDGDSVIVLPLGSNNLSISATPRLEGLKGFDPKAIYKLPESAPKMKNSTKQTLMGITTNLIADMTAQGAPPEDMVRAVKHSMVVIDAEKHHLDYKQSARDNNIQGLKDTYQKMVDPLTGRTSTGASTIFSKSKNPIYINKRKEVTDTSIMTEEELKRWNEGKKVWRDTGELSKKLITDTRIMTADELERHAAGKKIFRDSTELKQVKVSRGEVVEDAMLLIRDPNNDKEVAYAKYSNDLRALANEARKESRKIKAYPISAEAKKTYSAEVESLNMKLRIAESNNPRERRATMIANAMMSEKKKSNPDMSFDREKREEARCMNAARAMVGAKKKLVNITDKEWEAIQARAVPSTTLARILNNTDIDAFKKRATPRGEQKGLSAAKMAKLKSMAASGLYTQKEIAESLGISASTVSELLRAS